MRLALCNEVLREAPFAFQCELAAAYGYDGVEVAPFTLADDPSTLPRGEVAALRRAAEAAGVEVTGLHWLLLAPEGLSVTSPDAEVRQRTLETAARLIRRCADLGGSYVVHGSPAQRRLAPGREAEDRANAMDWFAEAARQAEAAGITYVLEPLSPDQTNFVTSVAEAADVVEQIGSPAFSTMIDCSAAALSEVEPVPDLLARWLPTGHLSHVHLNDPNRRGPGQGTLDFAPILAALRAGGYDGWAGVEPFDYHPDGPAAAARAAGYIRGIEAALEASA